MATHFLVFLYTIFLVFLPVNCQGQGFIVSQRVRHGGATEHACTMKWISMSRNKIFERIPYVFQGRHAGLQILSHHFHIRMKQNNNNSKKTYHAKCIFKTKREYELLG